MNENAHRLFKTPFSTGTHSIRTYSLFILIYTSISGLHCPQSRTNAQEKLATVAAEESGSENSN